MGVYLSAPVVDKESSNQACPDQGFTIGTSSMQGWRITQEDAHNTIPVFDAKTNTSLFAVYDGHGGSEVAKYCELHFPDFIKKLMEIKTDWPDNPVQFIQSAFLAFDATLTSDEVIKELKALAGKEDDNDEDDDDSPVGRKEADLLKEEAEMPLEQLLAQYNKPPGADSTNSSAGGSSEEIVSSCSAGSSKTEGCSSAAGSSSITGGSNAGGSSNKKASGSDTSENSNNCAISAADSTTNTIQEAGGSSSCGSGASANLKSMKGERACKVNATSDISKLIANPDSEDDSSEDDDEIDEDQWEDCSDEEDDDDEEEEEGVDKDVPMMDTSDEEPGSDSGCTACVLLKQSSRLLIANAGDSRCVLARAGRAVDLSFDHKPEDLPEKQRIEKAGGKVTADGRVNGGLNLSRAIGDHVYKQNSELPAKDQMISALPDVHTEQLTPEDEFVVLACDGIWNSMTSQEVVDFVADKLKDPETKEKPASICEMLFDACLAPNTHGDGTGCDNMTCIIVVLDGSKCQVKEDRKIEGNEEKIGSLDNTENKQAIVDPKEIEKNGEVINQETEHLETDIVGDKTEPNKVSDENSSKDSQESSEKCQSQETCMKRCADVTVDVTEQKRRKLEENLA